MKAETNEVLASSDDVACPTCNAAVGKRCVKRFTDWPESIPHETRVEAAERLVPSVPEPEPDFPPGHFSNLLPGDVPEPAPPLPMEGLFTEPARGRGSRALSRNEASQRYSCALCGDKEVYRAIDNRAKHAHLCEGCWLDGTEPQRALYDRVGPGGRTMVRHHPKAKVKRSSMLGFPTATIPPDSTNLLTVFPQIGPCRPTHLYILQRSWGQAMLASLRAGNIEHLEHPVPIELYRPISDELIFRLSRGRQHDVESLTAVLADHCRVDMRTVMVGSQISIQIQNRDENEVCVVDASLRVLTVDDC